MKTFKDFITMNEAKDNFLTPAEIKKLKAHYDGNPGLRSISQSIKDFESDHEAFVKLKGNVDKSVKDNMIKTSARLRKLGIEDGALNEDSDSPINESASAYKELKEINKGREGKTALDIKGEEVKGSVYLGNGSMADIEGSNIEVTRFSFYDNKYVTYTFTKDQVKWMAKL